MARIHGIDLARGLAVLGMVTAHIGPGEPGDPLPWSLTQVADGRSAALFVVLSGVSVGLMSGGAHPVDGIRRVQTRTRILTRAFALLAIGVFLALLQTPVVVILPTYALLFAVASALLGTSVRRLLIASVVVILLGPPLRLYLSERIFAGTDGGGIVELTIGPYYPALIWIAYLMIGLAVVRSDLSRVRTRWTLAVGGARAALIGYGGAAILTRITSETESRQELVVSTPHSSSTFEVLGNSGVACLTLVACLIIAERWPRAVAPLTATGALSLTAYAGHILVLAILARVASPDGGWVTFTAGGWLIFLAAIVAGCWAWRATLGPGPAERLLHAISARAADITTTTSLQTTATSESQTTVREKPTDGSN